MGLWLLCFPCFRCQKWLCERGLSWYKWISLSLSLSLLLSLAHSPSLSQDLVSPVEYGNTRLYLGTWISRPRTFLTHELSSSTDYPSSYCYALPDRSRCGGLLWEYNNTGRTQQECIVVLTIRRSGIDAITKQWMSITTEDEQHLLE